MTQATHTSAANEVTNTEVRKFHLVGITSDICLDDPEEGEGESTGCGYGGEKIGKTFNSFESMLKYLADHYGLSGDKNDYDDTNAGFLSTDRSVADHSQAQNGGWFEPTEAEYEQWRAGTLKLYVEHFGIEFHEVA